MLMPATPGCLRIDGAPVIVIVEASDVRTSIVGSSFQDVSCLHPRWDGSVALLRDSTAAREVDNVWLRPC